MFNSRYCLKRNPVKVLLPAFLVLGLSMLLLYVYFLLDCLQKAGNTTEVTIKDMLGTSAMVLTILLFFSLDVTAGMPVVPYLTYIESVVIAGYVMILVAISWIVVLFIATKLTTNDNKRVLAEGALAEGPRGCKKMLRTLVKAKCLFLVVWPIAIVISQVAGSTTTTTMLVCVKSYPAQQWHTQPPYSWCKGDGALWRVRVGRPRAKL